MKRILCLWSCIALMIFGFTGIANAVVFTDITDLNVRLGYGSGNATGNYSWTHKCPTDFEVPFDNVNGATLEIFADDVNGTNDRIRVEGILQGNLTNREWIWTAGVGQEGDGALFDIPDVFVSWTTGDLLDITLRYREVRPSNYLYLDRSEFTLDYDNETTPVPEPATMLLFGPALLGLIGYKRKQA